MPSYIVSHWRGRQSLTRSTIINGLVAYLLLVGVLVASQPPAYFGLGVLFVWWLWASVGIFRCAKRLVSSPDSTLGLKVAGFVALAGLLLATVYVARDLIRLFHLPL